METIENEKDLNLLAERNIDGKLLDFGSIKTDGAFRVVFESTKSWMLIPLPHGNKFTASLDLKKLGAKSTTIKNVEVLEPQDASELKIGWKQKDETLKISASSKAFGYRIEFE